MPLSEITPTTPEQSQRYYDASTNCFFNALLREWSSWTYRETAADQVNLTNPISSEHGCFIIASTDKLSVLEVPCTHYSECGRHHLALPCRIISTAHTNKESSTKEADFLQSVQWLFTQSAMISQLKAPDINAFLTRVKQSDHNLNMAIGYRSNDMDKLFKGETNFKHSEAALFTGHSIHPCPKARDNFSPEDAIKYCPEFGQEFQLEWYKVHSSALYIKAAEGFSVQHLITDIAAADIHANTWLASLDNDEFLIPCHPFQHKIWQQHSEISTLIAAGKLTHIGKGALPWSATSSVRAIYSEASPWMLKFSLSVKLTNSIRHLQPEELVRGAELCRVLETPPAQAYLDRFECFTLLKEPTAIALCLEDGLPIEEGIVLFRENPFRAGEQNNTEVLASLLQDDPRTGTSRLEQRLKYLGTDYATSAAHWFNDYLDVAVKPLLIGQADYGLLFGAHQQNIVLQLENGFPKKMYFRDCQGTGFSQLATELYSPYLDGMAEESANLLPDSMAICLFSYYLIINATFNVISSLGRHSQSQESAFLVQLKKFLIDIKNDGVRDSQCIDYLLSSPELNAKGNFLVSLQQLNENTETDYLAMYHPMNNPLRNLEVQ